MYDENSFKDHLFWIKIKRIFLMVVFSIVGCILGIIISSFVVDVLLFSSVFRFIIVALYTLLFFAISLLTTSNTGKEIQDGYWKIATLRKLTLISKKLDYLEKLDNLDVLLNVINSEKTGLENNIPRISPESYYEEEEIETTPKKSTKRSSVRNKKSSNV